MVIIKCVFVLFLGLVFGFVLQSAGFLVSSVDKFAHGGDSSVFTADRRGVSYVQ